MDERELTDVFTRYGAISKGHFKLSSGRHSDTYVQCTRVLQHPRIGERLADELASHYQAGSVDVVLSPALGGVVIGFLVARCLSRRFVFAERKEGEMSLRRGQDIAAGERVLIVEDVITTGGSIRELEKMLERKSAVQAGIAAIIARGESSEIPPGTRALLGLPVVAWEPDDCPLCRQGLELDAPGSRYL